MSTNIEKDDITGTETTGHDWDGIKELNNPVPRWWLYILYATIIFSVIYWVLYPSWPTPDGGTKGVLGWTQHGELSEAMENAKVAQAGFLARIAKTEVQAISSDGDLLNFALAGGRAAFGDNCAPCHGSGAQGFVGYPNLNDDHWLWGGTVEDIYTTIRYGIRTRHEDTRESEMPAFGHDEILSKDEIGLVADHVLSLTGQGKSTADAAELFADNCSACHGENGEGDTDQGAPRLNDALWLYGGERSTIVESVSKSRAGVMPAWESRLDDAAIKSLAVYVHSLGGGK
jgi:cytochrome c oxidase cbb3-type subunit 3